MHDHEFHQLLDLFELSRSGYRKVRKGVKKRIGRHLQQLGCRNFSAYLAALGDNVEARNHCRRLLTVSISRFFRDRQLWQDLERKVFPKLVQSETNEIRIWSAGCACGEEVYTIKIIWDRMQGSPVPLPLLRITATDLNPLYLEKARDGCYSPSSLREVPDALRSIYFKPVKGMRRYGIQSFLKDNIIWQTSDFFSGPPGSGYHVIFVRNNLLTYYREHLQKIALLKIFDSLADNGFLVIGAHEALPVTVTRLVPFNSCRYVFRKVIPSL